jgi:hypothetical protein
MEGFGPSVVDEVKTRILLGTLNKGCATAYAETDELVMMARLLGICIAVYVERVARDLQLEAADPLLAWQVIDGQECGTTLVPFQGATDEERKITASQFALEKADRLVLLVQREKSLHFDTLMMAVRNGRSDKDEIVY